jgi:hypothetical protein
MHIRIETLSLVESLDATDTWETSTSLKDQQTWKEGELERTVYFWFIGSVFEKAATSHHDNAPPTMEWSR